MGSPNLQQFATMITQLGAVERFVFGHEDSFTAKFCKGNVLDLSGVWFSSEGVRLAYVLTCGQHVTDHIAIADFIAWYQALVE